MRRGRAELLRRRNAIHGHRDPGVKPVLRRLHMRSGVRSVPASLLSPQQDPIASIPDDRKSRKGWRGSICGDEGRLSKVFGLGMIVHIDQRNDVPPREPVKRSLKDVIVTAVPGGRTAKWRVNGDDFTSLSPCADLVQEKAKPRQFAVRKFCQRCRKLSTVCRENAKVERFEKSCGDESRRKECRDTKARHRSYDKFPSCL
jgi:hypothetical protein